jgi:hypothetical protein
VEQARDLALVIGAAERFPHENLCSSDFNRVRPGGVTLARHHVGKDITEPTVNRHAASQQHKGRDAE